MSRYGPRLGRGSPETVHASTPGPGAAGSDAAFELLLACARVELGPAQEARVRELLATPLDWPRLYALAGQVFAMFILTVAAAEAAIGLAIVVTYFRNRGTIEVEDVSTLKG